MPYRQTWLRCLLSTAFAVALPACLLAPNGPAAGSTVCDVNGNCVTQSTSTCAEYGDEASCENDGCVWGAYCAGAASPCAYLDDASCSQQEGCGWDDNTGTCGGSEGACSAFVGPACTYQIGCEDAYGCFDS